jgi:putative endonuclease
MTSEGISLGKYGEFLARERLKSLGYKIIENNYTCKLGEIDLIAKDDDVLVFVEVKTRRNTSLGEAKDAVNAKKQRQISKVALYYMQSKNLIGAKARFDVAAVILVNGKKNIEVLKNAFNLAYD